MEGPFTLREPTSTDDWWISKVRLAAIPESLLFKKLLILGFQVLFASPRPPEACTRSLGRRKRQGWGTPTYSRGAMERCCVFMDAYFSEFSRLPC